jgi:predicted thioredoxin/glutaredoxin
MAMAQNNEMKIYQNISTVSFLWSVSTVLKDCSALPSDPVDFEHIIRSLNADSKKVKGKSGQVDIRGILKIPKKK